MSVGFPFADLDVMGSLALLGGLNSVLQSDFMRTDRRRCANSKATSKKMKTKKAKKRYEKI